MLFTVDIELPDGTEMMLQVVAADQLQAAEEVQMMLGFHERRSQELQDPRNDSIWCRTS